MWIGFQDLDWSGFDQLEFDWNWIWIEVKWDWIDTKNWIGFLDFSNLCCQSTLVTTCNKIDH